MGWKRQVIKFSLVGTLAAAIDFGGYFLLTRFFLWFAEHYIVASFITSSLAVTAAFVNNRRWTFRANGMTIAPQYTRYVAVYVLGILWQNFLLLTFVELVGIPDWMAKVAAVLVVAFGWNFLLAKFWVFRYTRASTVDGTL